MSKEKDIRREQIESILYEEKRIDVKTLAKRFDVTTETIRSDLEFLETKGALTRTHGGAVYRTQTIEPTMDTRKIAHLEEKKKIAKEALAFINDGSIIYIDGASTSLPLSYLLNTKNDCTIVTNNVELVNILSRSKHKVFLLGGEVSGPGKRTYGDFSLQMIKYFHFDVCIFGMDGSFNTKAPANMSFDEVIINEYILNHSEYSILMCDSSKFYAKSRFKFAEFSDFDCLITTKVPKEFKSIIDIKTIIETEK